MILLFGFGFCLATYDLAPYGATVNSKPKRGTLHFTQNEGRDKRGTNYIIFLRDSAG
jgi:hypothetical protein